MNQQDRGIMSYFEAEAHSFVVRIWRESGDKERGQAGEWRGWLEHVQSGQRHYFGGLNELPAIMGSYIGDADSLDDQIFAPMRSPNER